MYIVAEKKTDKILWKNTAPLEQGLKGKDVWGEFNSEKHKIIECDSMPKNPVIDGMAVRAMSMQEQCDSGIIEITENQKIVDNEIVEKTDQEKIDVGIMSLNDIKERRKEKMKGKMRAKILEAIIDKEFVQSLFDSVCAKIDVAKNVKEIEKIK